MIRFGRSSVHHPWPSAALLVSHIKLLGMVGLAVMSSLAALATPAAAQQMRIGSSNPTGTKAGPTYTTALFAAGDTKAGVELWYHTATSTSRLIDVFPGPVSSYPTEITRLSPTSGETWFVARAGRSVSSDLGRELHYYPKLPNTTGGWIKDIVAGAGSSHPTQLTLVGSRLFFTAIDHGGRELWTSDGTAAGTVRLKDIAPGGASSHPFGLTAYGKLLVFAATDKNGTELWVSDGSAAGTVMLGDLRPGPASSTPAEFVEFKGRLYFAATTDRTGRELWCTNGTAAGTVEVADLAAGPSSSSPNQLRAGDSELAFTAWTKASDRQLFLWTGAAAVQKTNLVRGESIGALTAAGNAFWFRCHTPKVGQELWRCDPTGVGLVHDMRPGTDGSFPSNITPFGKGVLFRCDDGKLGQEYWRTDGSTATLIKDVRAGDCSARPSRLVPLSLGGRPSYLFAAKGDQNGIEFWQTNGTTANLVMDIDPLPVLPGLHWDSDPAAISITVKDATPLQPGLLIIGTGIMQPLALPWLRGVITIDLFGPIVLLPFSTDRLGQWSLRFPPITPNQRTLIVSQAVVRATSGVLEASVPGSCNQGTRDLNPPPNTPPNGPRVEGRICLDDESGEYLFCAQRTDANPASAYIGLYQKGPTGDLEFLMSTPIEPGDFIEESGQIEILLPLDFDDMPGRHLEMHLFQEEPTPEGASPASLVTTSYC